MKLSLPHWKELRKWQYEFVLWRDTKLTEITDSTKGDINFDDGCDNNATIRKVFQIEALLLHPSSKSTTPFVKSIISYLVLDTYRGTNLECDGMPWNAMGIDISLVGIKNFQYGSLESEDFYILLSYFSDNNMMKPHFTSL